MTSPRTGLPLIFSLMPISGFHANVEEMFVQLKDLSKLKVDLKATNVKEFFSKFLGSFLLFCFFPSNNNDLHQGYP